jgi:hypothetical protein
VLECRARLTGVRPHFEHPFATKDLPLHCKPTALVVVEQDSLLANQFAQDRVLGAKVVNRFLLPTIDPTGKNCQ